MDRENNALKNSSVDKQSIEKLVELHGKEYLYNSLYPLLGYKERVPTIDEFIESDDYLGGITYNGKGIYPYWRKLLRDIFPTPYNSPYTTIMFRGAIGIGKSTVAKVIFAYDLAKFLLMENAHKKFGLIPTKEITFFLVSIQKNAVYKVLYSDLETWFLNSPFFKSYLNVSNKKTLFNNNINMQAGSRITDNIGLDIPTAIIDEIQQEIVHGQVKDNYNSVSTRIKSRFLQSGGELPGHVILCGSAGGADDFAEWLTNKSRHDKDILIIEPPQWEVLRTKKKDLYCGINFKVYAGDEFKDPFVIPENPDPSIISNLNPERILEVPVELKPEFDKDIYIAIRDLAGISTLSNFKFISSIGKLSLAFTNRKSWFDKEVYNISFFDNNDQLSNYMDPQTFKNRLNPSKPRFIHIDIGYANDLTGISCCHFSHFIKVPIENRMTGEVKNEWVPYIVTDFSIGIGRKAGEETPIFKFYNFIIELSGMGLNIACVSTDGHQSVEFRQKLTAAGFNTALISVDRTNTPYNALKSLILQERINIPTHELLKKELKELEMTDKGKVDHPSDGCLHPDTLIKTTEGNKKIKNLTMDDTIYSYDPKLKFPVPTTFRDLRVTKMVADLYYITTKKGKIRCTGNHPILTDKGYIRADNLVEGMKVIHCYDGPVEITQIDIIDLPTKTPVFDMEVPKYENFILGNGLVVHNSKDIADSLCGASYNALENSSKYLAMESLLNNTTDFDNFDSNVLTDYSADGVKDLFTKQVNGTTNDDPYGDLSLLGLE